MFRKNITYLRKSLKLSSLDFSAYLKENIPELPMSNPSTLANWETGKHIPKLSSLSLIANHFSISVDDLLSTDLSSLESTSALRKKIDNNVQQIFNTNLLISKYICKHLEHVANNLAKTRLGIVSLTNLGVLNTDTEEISSTNKKSKEFKLSEIPLEASAYATVRGDRFSPLFTNNSKMFFISLSELPTNTIGIFELNSKVIFKKFKKTKTKTELISLIDSTTITITAEDNFKVLGKLLV